MNMNIIHTYIHTYTHTYTHTHIHTYTHPDPYIHIHIYIYTYIYTASRTNAHRRLASAGGDAEAACARGCQRRAPSHETAAAATRPPLARCCPSINRAALRAFALSNGVVVAYALRVGRRSGASAACCRPFLPPSPPIPDCVGAVLVRTNPHLRARCVWAVIARVVAVN